jgi:hypothetical protein
MSVIPNACHVFGVLPRVRCMSSEPMISLARGPQYSHGVDEQYGHLGRHAHLCH